MSDLIDGYIRSGLVSDGYTKNFVECDGCHRMKHHDELFLDTVGGIAVCESCKERIDDENN